MIFQSHQMDKLPVIARILQSEGRGRTIIFARTKRTAARVAEDLASRGFATGALHGDLGQGAREQALRAFRNGKVDVLVATDVAARGIDVDDVTHVINYQCPEDEKIYVHRIGRTGRAGHKGTAVTFVDWDDVPRWRIIAKALGLPMEEPVETYHTSEHLFSDLSIPEGVEYAASLGLDPVVQVGEGEEAVPLIKNPVTFSRTPVRSRCRSVVPSFSSRLRMATVSVGWLTPSWRAAAVRLPQLATARK